MHSSFTITLLRLTIIFIILNQFEYVRDCNATATTTTTTKKSNRFLAHIFNKYGNGGVLSFEGLEHLMYNLGLGGLEFNLTHTIEEHHPDGYRIPDVLQFEDDDNTNANKIQNLYDEDNNYKYNRENINNFESNLNKNNNNIEFKKSDINNSENKDQIEYSKYDNDVVNNNNKYKDESILENYKIDLNEKFDTDLLSNKESVDVDNIVVGDGINFKEMHDPKHRHPRHHNDQTISDNKCLSPMSLIKLIIDNDDLHRKRFDYALNPLQQQQQQQQQQKHTVSKRYTRIESKDTDEDYNELISSVRITPDIFMKLCPALLVQIDQDACAQYIAETDNTDTHEFGYSWIYATIAIFIISCCGLIGIAIVPLIKSSAYDEILQFLVAIAIGTLCGDALMHLMPHALINEHEQTQTTSASDNHDNEPVWLCSCAFLTALFMYSIENLLPLLKGSNDNGHGHSHHHHSAHVKQSISNQEVQQQQNSTHIDMKSVPKPINLDANEINIMLNESKEDKKGTKLTPVAFMVVIGDGLHNLTDGLAIGAAFANDPVTGMATALAVLCHELPHELGDFALLLQTGLNVRRAIFLNIVSSILSFMGMAIGLFVAKLQSNIVRWIYSGTAGSFLYIALADLIPEIGRNENKTIKSITIQILGIFLGGLIMIIIALNEDKLRSLFE